MATLTIVMVHFPFVIIGLGQILIAGLSPARRTIQDMAKARAWGSVHAHLHENSKGQGEIVDKRATARLRQLPGRPVASLPRI
jgi:hypothetical protein